MENSPPKKPTERKRMSSLDLEKLKAEVKAERRVKGKKILNHMQEKQKFLKNPRYNRALGSSKALDFRIWNENKQQYSKFPDPPVIAFDGYEVGNIYTIHIQIQNVGGISQRIRIVPPTNPRFTLSTTDPCFQGKVMIPGDLCRFSISFEPKNGFKEEDTISVRSEICNMDISLVAQNPFPWVAISPTLELGICAIGQRVAALLSVVSHGCAANYHIFTDDDFGLVDGATSTVYNGYNIFRKQVFLAYPSRFRLEKDESRDILILFFPRIVGRFMCNLKVAAENGLVWTSQIIGEGVDIKVNVEEIDGQALTNSEEDKHLWFDQATISSENISRKVSVRNHSPLPLSYNWTMNVDSTPPTNKSTISLWKGHDSTKLKSLQAFNISPPSGVLDPNSSTSFAFTFSPNEVTSYTQQASLSINTKKMHPLQTPLWNQLKLIMKEITNNEDVNVNIGGSLQTNDQQENLADDVSRVMEVVEFTLSGHGAPLRVELAPPIIHLPGILQKGQSHTTFVMLKNKTHANISFSWQIRERPYGVTDDNHVFVVPLKGKINPMDKIKIEVCLQARKIGTLNERVTCNIVGGPPVVLLVEGSIEGPQIQISPSTLDFGIVQVGSQSSLQINLKNLSRCSASFKLSTTPKIPTKTNKATQQLLAFQEHNPISKIQEYPVSSMVDLVPKNEGAQKAQEKELLFFPTEGLVPAKASVKVDVLFQPSSYGTQKWAIICEVEGGISSTQYVIANMLAAGPHAVLCPSSFDFGIAYLGIPIERTAYIQNLSPLPIHFGWSTESCFDPIDIQPQQGEISPQATQDFAINLTPTVIGERKYLAVCQVIGMKEPLPLHFRLFVADACFSYNVQRPLKSKHNPYIRREFSKYDPSKERSIDRSKLPTIDFGNRVPLGTIQCARVVVRNDTALPGRVKISIQNYGLPPNEEHIAELTSYLGSKSEHKIILNDNSHKATHRFSSKNGFAMLVQQLWSTACVNSGQGIVTLVSHSEGNVEEWSSWYCDVFCYVCMPGIYNDFISFKVENNKSIKIPLKIGVVGTPLIMRDYKLEPNEYARIGEKKTMILKWHSEPAGYPISSKTFWVTNVAPLPLELEWEGKESDLSPDVSTIKVDLEVEEDVKVHVIILGNPDGGPIQLKFEIEDCTEVRVRLNESFKPITQGSPFQIVPVKQLIPSRSTVSFKASFYSEDSGKFLLNLIGNTVIPMNCSEFNPRFSDIPPLYVGLEAISCEPRLRTNIDESLKFSYYGACSMETSVTKHTILLTNEYSYDLHFSITPLDPHFNIVKRTRKLAKNGAFEEIDNPFIYDSIMSLPPGDALMLDIVFNPTKELTREFKNLKIEGNLILNFLCTFKQTISLIGYLFFPAVVSYFESLSFGKVLLQSSYTIPLTITNTSKMDAQWSVIQEENTNKELVSTPKLVSTPVSTPKLVSTPVSTPISTPLATPKPGSNPKLVSTTSTPAISTPLATPKPNSNVAPSEVKMGTPSSIFAFDSQYGTLMSSNNELSTHVIKVKFSPKEPKLYSQRVYVKVSRGQGFSLLLEGEGVLETPTDQATELAKKKLVVVKSKPTK